MAAGRTWLRFAMMAARRGSPIPAGRSIQSLEPMAETGRTRREFERDLREHRNPAPISIPTALASTDPIYEISRRLSHCPFEQMSNAEQEFFLATYFLADALNGGLDQALFNSIGDDFTAVVQFAESYCDASVADVLGRLGALFPNAIVPRDRDSRGDIVVALNDSPGDPIGALTTEFYDLEDEYRTGLLKLIQVHSDEFSFPTHMTVRGDGF
jgi:hypothetical protein